MTAYMDLTAADLADCLDTLGSRKFPAEGVPGSTTALSALDEAAGAYMGSGSVASARRAFSAARIAHMDSFKPGWENRGPEAWAAAVQAAHALADALRELDERASTR